MPNKGRGRPEKKDRNAKMVQMRKRRMTYRAIAKKTKMDVKTVWEILERHRAEWEKAFEKRTA